MPTKRRKLVPRRLNRMTLAQESHLSCGHYFFDFDGELDHFVDEVHRRATWAANRELILAKWSHPGRRPVSMWEYDAGLKRRPWPREWSWPRPVASEAEMVHRLLKRGELQPCRFNGTIPVADEVAVIEANWLREIGYSVGCGDTMCAFSGPLPTYGCPKWFYQEHAPAIFARQRAERVDCERRFRGGLLQ
jgi:hypothetical protein